MPKKGKKETQAEQSERFTRDVQSLIEAGELDPVVAAERFERVVRASRTSSRAKADKISPPGEGRRS